VPLAGEDLGNRKKHGKTKAKTSSAIITSVPIAEGWNTKFRAEPITRTGRAPLTKLRPKVPK
jgi:hypothetical protein